MAVDAAVVAGVAGVAVAAAAAGSLVGGGNRHPYGGRSGGSTTRGGLTAASGSVPREGGGPVWGRCRSWVVTGGGPALPQLTVAAEAFAAAANGPTSRSPPAKWLPSPPLQLPLPKPPSLSPSRRTLLTGHTTRTPSTYTAGSGTEPDPAEADADADADVDVAAVPPLDPRGG